LQLTPSAEGLGVLSLCSGRLPNTRTFGHEPATRVGTSRVLVVPSPRLPDTLLPQQ
jgi:hypothetical protein